MVEHRTLVEQTDPDRRLRVTIGDLKPTASMDMTDPPNQALWLPVLGPTSTMVYRRLLVAAGHGGLTATELMRDVGATAGTRLALDRLERFGAIRQLGNGGIEVRTALRPFTAKQLARIPAVLSGRYEAAGFGPTSGPNVADERIYPLDTLHLDVRPDPRPTTHKLPAGHAMVTELRASIAGPTTAVMIETLQDHAAAGHLTVDTKTLAAELGVAHLRGGWNSPFFVAFDRMDKLGVPFEHHDGNGHIHLPQRWWPTGNQLDKRTPTQRARAIAEVTARNRPVNTQIVRPDPTRLTEIQPPLDPPPPQSGLDNQLPDGPAPDHRPRQAPGTSIFATLGSS